MGEYGSDRADRRYFSAKDFVAVDLPVIPEQVTVKAQEPLIPKWLYKICTSMEAAIFNCQCDQMQNSEGGCEAINWSA